ncbi:hypothetical protein E0485_17575 [Paenibacillus albiflavus]|uniref:YheC/YheD family protein n=1 Tax=Paenibacillus albiflavus TaxID=2545760 RepID=A0A4R4E954_9BACL|nr:YheC/YheD family protein [Paenibacillus albiflavus]TCZ75410.1 hypothetical protein E0485_17575 [Paenibacillus albiflavus]
MSKKYRSTHITGKLTVHHYLLSSSSIKHYLPHTIPFSKANLERMISRYKMLYIKPNAGSQGIGIYQLVRDNKRYTLKSTSKINKSFASLQQLYDYIKPRLRKKYIIQQGIYLEKVNGNTYDLRTMIQRKPKKAWAVTGTFAKIARPNMIVNNYYQGSRVAMMNQLFDRLNLDAAQSNARMAQIHKVSHKIAEQLSKKKSGLYELGIDYAYDHHGHLWVLEVNSRHPQIYLLKKIAPDMYNRMLKYAKSIGRSS